MWTKRFWIAQKGGASIDDGAAAIDGGAGGGGNPPTGDDPAADDVDARGLGVIPDDLEEIFQAEDGEPDVSAEEQKDEPEDNDPPAGDPPADGPPSTTPIDTENPLPPDLQRIVDNANRREIELREKEKELGDVAKLKDVLRRVKEGDQGALQALGVNVEDIVAKKLGLVDEEPEIPKWAKSLQDRLDGFERQRQEESQRALQHQTQTRLQEAERNMITSYQEFAEKSADAFPHLHAFREQAGPSTMYDHASRFARKTGQWLGEEQAAQAAEAQLEADMKAVLDRARSMPQYSGLFVPQTSNGESQEATQAKASNQPRDGGKTLRNKQQAESPKRVDPKDLTDATDAEIIAAGLAAWNEAG